ncbi:MAG: hypothetical protein IRY85_09935, partial [Micromonosporaceae bacterium]|nr:hypothetical protein [Micromonosporaceae bacterium]
WWYEAVALSHRFRRRRRLAAAQLVTAAVDAGAVPVPVAWLRTLAPEFSLRSVTVGGHPVAVGTDAEGWFAVAEIGSLWDDDLVAAPAGGPAESVWAPTTAAPRPGEVVPQPAPLPGSAAARSVPYRELAALLEQVSAVQVVLVPGASSGQPRPAWVAVRVTPADALATERSGGVSAVERTVAAAVAKAVRTLDAAGWPARPVTPDGLVPTLVEATGLDGPPQEHWSWWRAGRTVRTHYAVAGWRLAHGTLAGGVSHLSVRFDRRDGVADVRTGDGVTYRRTGDDELAAGATVTAAVTAAPAALRRVCEQVVSAAAAQSVRVLRLDGEQAPAAWATAPTASARVTRPLVHR